MERIASSSLHILQRPRIAPPQQMGGLIKFGLTHAIEAKGEVAFAGRGSRSLEGWTLGFAQVQRHDTRWTVYRGTTAADGSVFEQNARPPARTQQACFDGDKPGAIWYFDQYRMCWLQSRPNDVYKRFVVDLPDVPGGGSPFEVFHQDVPAAGVQVFVMNGKTKAMNYLAAAQTEIAFCTALIARDPAGQPHFLQSFYWTIRWQYRFARLPGTMQFRASEVAGGVAATVSKVIKGAPPERRLAELLKGGQPTTCTILGRRALAKPHLTETADWRDFDVRR